MLDPCRVLDRYPGLLRGNPVANPGGFSGASIWRIDGAAGSFCLKAFPPSWRSADDLAWIHGLLDKAAGLPWMPRVMRSMDGRSSVDDGNRLWELVTWMPGAADFAQAPTIARLQAAAQCLAHLHQAWAGAAPRFAACPAIERRLEAWHVWQTLLHSGWRPMFDPLDPCGDTARELMRLLPRCDDELTRSLGPRLAEPVALQPCVCDLWHDHVLFAGDVVTGFVDFGSAKMDHVAVDLARMLGSLIGADAAMWEIGLDAYARVRPLTIAERQLARELDRTGTIIAATQWLRWLYHENRAYERREAVAARLHRILRRLQGCGGR